MTERREINRAQRFKESETPLRDKQANQSAKNSEQQTFGQQLFDDLSARCAKRGSHRQFMTARGAAREKQIGDVRARDEKDEGDGARQDKEGGPNFSRQFLPQRHHFCAPARVELREIICGDDAKKIYIFSCSFAVYTLV